MLSQRPSLQERFEQAFPHHKRLLRYDYKLKNVDPDSILMKPPFHELLTPVKIALTKYFMAYALYSLQNDFCSPYELLKTKHALFEKIEEHQETLSENERALNSLGLIIQFNGHLKYLTAEKTDAPATSPEPEGAAAFRWGKRHRRGSARPAATCP